MEPIVEQLSDKRHTIIDYKKENRKLSDKLSSVTQKLVQTQNRLREERKLQEMKLTELGIKLLEFEEGLRVDQKRVKMLLKRKDKQLLEKDKLIEALKCQLNVYEGRISCGSPIDVKVSDFSTIMPRTDHEINDTHAVDSGTQKPRDFSHLLYLDLNTDQFGGRRFYAHRDLSPVAEVREDLEELMSPCRATNQGKRTLFGTLENDTSILLSENVKIEDKGEHTQEKERFQDDAHIINDNGGNSEPIDFHEFSDALLSCYKDQLSPKTMLGVQGDIPNFNEISDGHSDDVKKILMNSQNILSEGIMNTSFEDQMLGFTSGLLGSPKRENKTGKHFRRDPDDNTSHLRRAQKEIRRSLVIDDSEDYDEKDEFYDCPTALSDHTGSIIMPEKQTLQSKHEVDARISLVHRANTSEPHKENHLSDANKVRLQDCVGVRNESPESESNVSLKEEWSDAQDSVADQLHDDSANIEQYSTPKKTLDSIKKSDSCKTALSNKTAVIQQNGLSSDLSGAIITSCPIKLDSTQNNKRKNDNTSVAPGDTTLEEYDVIDMDIDAKLSE